MDVTSVCIADIYQRRATEKHSYSHRNITINKAWNPLTFPLRGLQHLLKGIELLNNLQGHLNPQQQQDSVPSTQRNAISSHL